MKEGDLQILNPLHSKGDFLWKRPSASAAAAAAAAPPYWGVSGNLPYLTARPLWRFRALVYAVLFCTLPKQ
eukprot:843882-Pelagomonas_calceolata.AAC.2